MVMSHRPAAPHGPPPLPLQACPQGPLSRLSASPAVVSRQPVPLQHTVVTGEAIRQLVANLIHSLQQQQQQQRQQQQRQQQQRGMGRGLTDIVAYSHSRQAPAW